MFYTSFIHLAMKSFTCSPDLCTVNIQ